MYRNAAAFYDLQYSFLDHEGASAQVLQDVARMRPGAEPQENHPMHDLPAGAGRLVQRSDGYAATIVAGEIVVDHGELTDARPGRVVRSH